MPALEITWEGGPFNGEGWTIYPSRVITVQIPGGTAEVPIEAREDGYVAVWEERTEHRRKDRW